MNRYLGLWQLQPWLLVVLLFGLSGCSSEPEAPLSQEQAYFFTESLRQVADGGGRLQAGNLDEESLRAALATIDEGLRLAFQVQREGLDKLDLRLGKNFQRYFIEGIENYRLGIEAGDEAQQRKGLNLLARWGEFWAAEQDAIMAQLAPD